MAKVDEDLDAEAAELEGDEEEEDVEDEDEDEELDESDEGAYNKLETRLTKRVATQIANYTANQAKRLDKYTSGRKTWLQRRLDEFALAHMGTAAIGNPQAVRESIERQVSQAEARLVELQAQMDRLAEIEAAQNAEVTA